MTHEDPGVGMLSRGWSVALAALASPPSPSTGADGVSPAGINLASKSKQKKPRSAKSTKPTAAMADASVALSWRGASGERHILSAMAARAESFGIETAGLGSAHPFRYPRHLKHLKPWRVGK